jgi:hypothetical protein
MVKQSIYLTGGAFGMIYQMGALSAAKSEISDKPKYIFYGCSAGALTAVMTLLGYSDEFLLQIYNDISERALDKINQNPYSYDTYNLTPHNFQVFEQINRDYPHAYRILTRKKLHIGVTMETGFQWFKRFRSNNDLFNILLCSFHVPFLCSYNALIRGVRCIDGGFGCQMEQHLPPNTLVICPKHTESSKFDVLNGEMTVKACVIPCPLEERMFYYKQGFDAMNQYMKSGKANKSTTVKIDEVIVPNSVWWALRRLQPKDTVYTLSNIFHNQTFYTFAHLKCAK